MRPFINHSCRLAFRSSRRPQYSGFSINYFCVLRFHTAFTSCCVDEQFAVPIGHNGEVKLRVTRPAAQVQSKSSGQNVILYLPPGPLFHGLGADLAQHNEASLKSHEELDPFNAGSLESSPQHLLASATSATVVTINYRLGKQHGANAQPENTLSENEQSSDPEVTINAQPDTFKYPTPIHDTLAGFDWIKNNLNPAHLTVFGSHIGGSLALVLALTEAQSVQAVAAYEPVCDWPGLDDHCAIEDAEIQESTTESQSNHGIKRPPRKKIPSSPAPPDLVPLLEAREKFFSSPERCFDAFASPILFLRSAGRDTPRAFPRYLMGPGYPVPKLIKTRRFSSAEHNEALDGSSWDRDVDPDVDAEDPYEHSVPVVRRRKALSRWPPYGLDYGVSGKMWSGPGHGIGRLQVTLPWVRVFLRGGVEEAATGYKNVDAGHTVLAKQGEEMVSVMRRACFWGREKGFGEKKVTLARMSTSPEEEAGVWLNTVFDGSIEED